MYRFHRESLVGYIPGGEIAMASHDQRETNLGIQEEIILGTYMYTNL